MTIQTFYPIFEHGQVLTSSQLNDMVDYLEQQDRLSRRTLSGVGIVCGFDVDRSGLHVSISGGVAVTSEGYLITAADQTYDRVRDYDVPIPTAEEATPEDIDAARYPFLFDDDGAQIPVRELVDTDFVAAPGEDDPAAIIVADLDASVIMLFLEDERASLKSCDVNDCSDKGAERRFALRRLLLTREQAEAIVAQETAIANAPTDKGRHPRLDLPYMRIEKLALAREGIDNFGALSNRVLTIAQRLTGSLPDALRGSFAAYGYMLGDMFVEGDRPFPDTYFSNIWGQVAGNIFLVQYFYDYMRDVAMAYNEFTAAAAQLEAVCQANPERFPRHVLLGDVSDQPDAYAATFPTVASVLGHDHLGASTGAGLRIRPALRRTHFVPSPAHDTDALGDVRALFLRMHLLAMTFRLDGLITVPVRITPSREGGAPLSARAIPFHYAFDRTTDLFRNWSPQKTRTNLLNTVYSYQLNPPSDAHPLAFRIDDQDFYRIEGVVGKALGSTMAELIAWKRELGLSFAIEPVYMRLSIDDTDAAGNDLDLAALAGLVTVLQKLLLCRMSDFDALLLLLLKTLFAFLVFIVRAIAGALADLQQQIASDTSTPPTTDTTGGLTVDVSHTLGGFVGVDMLRGGININETAANRFAAARLATILPPAAQEKLKSDSLDIQKSLKSQDAVRGGAVKLAVPDSKDGTIAQVYEKVQDGAAGGNLFDRTKVFVTEQGGSEADTQVVYSQVAMLDQGDQLMQVLNVDSLADFDAGAFDVAYRGFAGAYRNYAKVADIAPVAATAAQQETQLQVAAAAETVASDNTAFAVGNLGAEITTVVTNLLSGLTLDGFAKRHPGLEHSAGVSKGGTFVLAYTGLAELRRHLETIGGKMRASGQSVGRILGSDVEIDMQKAIADLVKSMATRTPEPLDAYVVLADFCLPYKCCDSDCSDVKLNEIILADPFGKGFTPKQMAVPPVTGLAHSGATGGTLVADPLPSASDTVRPEDAVLPPVIIVTGRSNNRLTVENLRAFERPTNLEEVIAAARRDRDSPVTPTPVGPTPDRPAAPAVIFGRVLASSGGRDVPVSDAVVLISLEDGTERREPVNSDGTFKIEASPGSMTIRATGTGISSRNLRIALDGGEERALDLRVTMRQ